LYVSFNDYNELKYQTFKLVFTIIFLNFYILEHLKPSSINAALLSHLFLEQLLIEEKNRVK